MYALKICVLLQRTITLSLTENISGLLVVPQQILMKLHGRACFGQGFDNVLSATPQFQFCFRINIVCEFSTGPQTLTVTQQQTDTLMSYNPFSLLKKTTEHFSPLLISLLFVKLTTCFNRKPL